MKDNRFNIRVYGLVIHQGRLLISHEKFKNRAFTKFPGGGLEWGEGIEDCLIREFNEELGIEIEPGFLFHVTSRFHQSSFYAEDQVVGVYFLISPDGFDQLSHSLDNEYSDGKSERFEWVPFDTFNPEILTFKTDREAAEKLLAKNKKVLPLKMFKK